MSQRLGEEGTSTLKVDIGADGVPTNVTVYRSSGSLRLDDAARELSWRAGNGLADAELQARRRLDFDAAVKWDLKEPPDAAYIAMAMQPADYPGQGAADKFEQGITGIFF